MYKLPLGVREYVANDPDVHILTDFMGVRDLEVNAFQRLTDVGIHMATKEGFGLVISEMLWKKVPVVARPVGGVKLQVLDGITGFLAWNLDELSKRVVELLSNSEMRELMGSNGRAHVLKNFTITKHAIRYLRIFRELARA
ncbi:MAG: glycosyltransferase [Candidatus Methanodesulfokora sp.]